jgi:hypothetical protein
MTRDIARRLREADELLKFGDDLDSIGDLLSEAASLIETMGTAAPVSPVKEEPPRMETESEHIARDMREGRFPKRSEPQVKEEQPKKPRCPRCGSGNPDTYLALANGEVCLHTFHEPALRKLDASRAEVTELVKARNELFDLRIRCGCGPDQEGPDIWQRLNSVTDTLRKARDYISEWGWHEHYRDQYKRILTKIDAALAMLDKEP